MIVLFLVDTSASMNQRVANGMTLLDLAKNSIENFIKVRAAIHGHRRALRGCARVLTAAAPSPLLRRVASP